ncbi:MAG: hypothetical protein SPL08_05695 [Pseudomonadota bacterium]|nr:hypothetical protein [Pseudomonadota bacterium]
MAEDLAPSAGKIRIKITCPTEVVADMEADSVLIPAVKGRCLIKPRKAPKFYLLNTGWVIIHQENKPDKVYRISRGVCEVRRDICAIMAWAKAETEPCPDGMPAELAAGERMLALHPKDTSMQAVKDKLDFYKFVLNGQKSD